MKSETAPTTFRVSKSLPIMIAVLSAAFATMGMIVFARTGRWELLASVVAVDVLCFSLLAMLRLEFAPDGFTYRTAFGSSTIAFADVERAWFEIVEGRNSGPAMFRVRTRGKTTMKLSLKLFPVESAAMLFTALESHGVCIEVPDAWHANYLVEKIRAAQARADAARASR